ncbi:centromere protein X isoform X2 [Xenopus tropicalis]|uniref:Centromere protein X isoform X2 n=1 Tax=Xenopus tropicalis TaxID=8364 RepID=A0A8J0R783_XENTR|nr:centromere protein X isoform X2 [Xenopus tropicalis]|eukprot:XP_004918620.1 PREDICTED: centromere protein X isoform X2 [Xenopus tropicalis]
MERDQDEVAFPKELVSKLLHEHLKNEKMRVSADALLLLAELLKVFVRDKLTAIHASIFFSTQRQLLEQLVRRWLKTLQ